ncbi:succinate dehydrogenase / fumarate reductase cytochrome b subunit [Brevibacillus aydinogluensis]|uniref:succinate dehydrogenase cytochrome b558 subunit n=1 Tax=Brevibacillus aydinogluensis TaxID=927786 RepID=UPI002892AD61|nr:succinate dehydrogenase cytochrome b558 subunit [Brevibacillus aydinogluensis]MDT3417054.1 succinate dehydrogenase / fumarate reductase cytochrome b subunit [Brevibacillus aydinogluensis]
MNELSTRRFLLARLHSLTGLVPLGLFLLEHLYSNAIALMGQEAYDRHVQTLSGIPFLPVVEVLFIALPLLYHAVYGIYIGMMAKVNPYRYAYRQNWLFIAQRVSGGITLVFVLYHIWAFRLSSLLFDAPVNYEAVQAHLQNPFIFAFYVLGVIATTFHFSNGLWTGLITWGITVGPRGQRISSVLRTLLFAGLCGVGVGALIAFW